MTMTPVSHSEALERDGIERRRMFVATLRLSGRSIREISAELAGMDPPIIVSKSQVARDIDAIKEEWRQAYLASWQDHVAVELATYNLRQATWLPKDLRGDAEAALQMDRIQRGRRALLGLDAPQRMEIDLGVSEGSVLGDAKARGLAVAQRFQQAQAEDAERRAALPAGVADAELVEDEGP